MKKTVTLDTPLEQVSRLTPNQKKALDKLSIYTVKDILYHFPARYMDATQAVTIGNLKKGDRASVFGKIHNLKTRKAFRKKIPMSEATLSDETGSIKIVWFHQPYIAKMVSEGGLVRVEGKVSERNGKLFLSNPNLERISQVPQNTGPLFGGGVENTLLPVYPESRGITSNWFYHAITKIIRVGLLDKLKDPIPQEVLKKYNLPTLAAALVWIHAPQKISHAESARKRFAFEEIFFIQLEKIRERKEYEKNPSFKIDVDERAVDELIARFPFEMTGAQNKAIAHILADLSKDRPMARLLEGDVGSGKTAVAAITAYAVIKGKVHGTKNNNLQVAIMAPTEILAQQHFENFISYFSYANIPVALITGSGCKKFPSKLYADRMRTGRGLNAEKITPWTNISRAQLLKWVASGEIPILVGTHALIQKSVAFKHLAYVIIDEQHRFGVNQRQALVRRLSQNERGLTQTNDKQAQGIKIDMLLYKDLTYAIRNCIFSVKKELGLGHKEQIYQRALEEEFTKRKIRYNSQKQIPVFYQKKQVGVYQPDFVIEDKIIIELKALPFVGMREKKQLWNYLKGSSYQLALLVNFGHEDVSIERVICDSLQSASNPHKSASSPHFLSMTATPIPRTLALTIYGDLDLTLLDEMPEGRKQVITEIVPPDQRKRIYEHMREELNRGRQAYVICPRIDEPDPSKELALNAKSVKEEALRLDREVFPEFQIAVLHGKMKPQEREQVMKEFECGEIQILVATSVIEVGVNVPNATMIVIEGAERFGLAQLHQLRGRVLRSTHQAYCFLFSDTKSGTSLERLKALSTAKNGFELSEMDLALRGAGELSGGKQWGISDVGMEAIRNIKMVEAAREEAQKMLASDPELLKFPAIKERIGKEKHDIHFE
jgi:GxxExxY protein